MLTTVAQLFKDPLQTIPLNSINNSYHEIIFYEHQLDRSVEIDGDIVRCYLEDGCLKINFKPYDIGHIKTIKAEDISSISNYNTKEKKFTQRDIIEYLTNLPY